MQALAMGRVQTERSPALPRFTPHCVNFNRMKSDLTIIDIRAFATSFPLPKDGNVRLGNGRAIKKDAVIVKVTTAGGLVGWGESHHARAPSTIANLIDGPSYV